MRPPAEGTPSLAAKVIAKLRPGAFEGTRSLPIRSSPDAIRARWDEPALRAAILQGIPAADATLEVGPADRDWGHTTTLRLTLTTPMPGLATNVVAGKALRRLKALTETGEIPTTDFNPSARADAGEATS